MVPQTWVMTYLSATRSSDLLVLNLVKPHFCEVIWVFLAANELELDLMQGFHHMLLILSLVQRDMMT